MTDPQPGVINDKDMAAVKMDIDAPYSAVLSSSAPSSAAAVSSFQENNGSSSATLKKAPQSTDDKAGSAGDKKASSQNGGGVEKGSSGSSKPKIKISQSASSSNGGGDKKSNGKSSTSSSIKKTKDGKKSSTINKPSTLKKTTSSGSYSGVGGGGGMQRSKAYQGNLRSAAAAHRKDKVAIPPIGSPGLLMMPNPALTANFPKDIQSPEELKQWLVNGHYLLPATVFRRAMEVGGYTVQQRVEQPHRGSSTERQVGDMFDSDVGGLYLHFPELIPRRVWERRLGGGVEDYNNDEEDMDDFPVRDRRKRRRKSGSKRRGSQSSDNTKNDGSNKSKDHHSGVKGARSSYIFFTHEMRPKMMQEFPGMKFTEQGIIMGERWRALTPEQKKPYEDLATEDKKRYATEWAAYLETVKKEIREEKEMGGKKKEDDGDTNKEEDDDDDDEDDDDEEEEEKPVVKPVTKRKKGNEAAIKGPRLVDAVILSLCNILGEKAYRTEPLPPMPQKNQGSLPTVGASTETFTPDSKPAAAASLEAPTSNADIASTVYVPKSSSDRKSVVPEQSESDSNIVKPANPDPILSSDTKVAATNGTKETIAQPSKDLALEELPKLNPILPQTRKRCRPHEPMSFLDMIPTSLTCTYPQEYVTKRRAYAEAVRAREEAIIASQEAKDDADDAQEKYLAHTEAWERMLEYQKQQIAKRAAERQRQKARKEAERKNDDKDGGDAETGNENSKEDEKEEDPMDCMPPRPKSPPPARVVSVPDIPTPPSPPQLFEIDGDAMETDNNTTAIRVPKKKTELLQHLDPECFIPNMDGRYFGLISNSIADPQFVGPTSTGIRGTTFGGGTGLATSYVGGGRGASGLVSGPSRSTVGSRASSTVLAMEEDSKTTTSASPDSTPAKAATKKKKRPAPSPPSSSSSSSKVKKKDKKETKKLCLATGDRITSATEVSSGPAGPEFPEGWVIKTYRRSGGETIGKTDRFWFSPGRNIRFRAKKHAKQFIDILNEPSINGDEDAAAEAYKKRGLHF